MRFHIRCDAVRCYVFEFTISNRAQLYIVCPHLPYYSIAWQCRLNIGIGLNPDSTVSGMFDVTHFFAYIGECLISPSDELWARVGWVAAGTEIRLLLTPDMVLGIIYWLIQSHFWHSFLKPCRATGILHRQVYSSDHSLIFGLLLFQWSSCRTG